MASDMPIDMLREIAKCNYEAWLGLRQCNKQLHKILDMSVFVASFTKCYKTTFNGILYHFWTLPDNKWYKYITIVTNYNSSRDLHVRYDVTYYLLNRPQKTCYWSRVFNCYPDIDIYVKTSQQVY
jgi:hypothetical protein